MVMVVKLVRWYVKIYSEEGHGTHRKLYLRRKPRKRTRHQTRARSGQSRRDGAILVVEDDALSREYVVAIEEPRLSRDVGRMRSKACRPRKGRHHDHPVHASYAVT